MDVYAVGVSSRKLGAATLFVTPALDMKPATGVPGGTTTAYGHNERAKPFRWRKREVKGSQLRNTVINLCN
jgi:hypothetical protein